MLALRYKPEASRAWASFETMIDALFYSRSKSAWCGDISRITLAPSDLTYIAEHEYKFDLNSGSSTEWDLIGKFPKPSKETVLERFSISKARFGQSRVWISCIPSDLLEGVLSRDLIEYELEHWISDELADKRNIDLPWEEPAKMAPLGHPLCVFESGIVRVEADIARKYFGLNIKDGRREMAFICPAAKRDPIGS